MDIVLLLLIPALYGAANLGDKFVVGRRVRATESYLVLIGAIHLVFGSSLSLFVDWSPRWQDLALAIPCGVFYAAQLYFYYVLFALEDASNVVGLEAAYPVLLAALAYVFLGERVAAAGHVGMLLIVGGLLAVTVRMRRVKLDARPWMIGSLILANALNEFFIKIAAGRLPGELGLAIESVVAGLLVCALAASPRVRRGVAHELRNLPYALGIEVLTLTSILCKFLAMARLPAVHVASVAAIQPLVVLAGERLFFSRGLVKDPAFAPKLVGLGVVAAGLALLLGSLGG